MVPGITEREIRVSELHRRDLLADAERRRFVALHTVGSASRTPAARLPRLTWAGLQGLAKVLASVRGSRPVEPVEIAGEYAAPRP